MLEISVRQSWPYNPSIHRVRYPPLCTTQHLLVFRVYQDPTETNSTDGLDQLPEEVREKAQKEGWEGPWELMTWAQLIAEVIQNQDLTLVDLPDIPREVGARKTNLHHYTTSLDAWGAQAARPKHKTAEYLITPEAWERHVVLQIPAKVARVKTPI